MVFERRSGLFIRYWLPLILYLAACSLLSVLPYPQVVLKLMARTPNLDKLLHLGELLILSCLVLRLLVAWRDAWPLYAVAVAAFLLAITYGAVSELAQRFVPGRVSSMADMEANALGAALGVIFYLGIVMRGSQRRPTGVD
jgi:VanZ family protein